MSAALVVPTFSADSLGKHVAYIKELSQRHTALSKLAFEEPSSTVRASPEVDEGRILALRHRVQEAWSKADGNPADGKWGFLTRLLRTGVTSGRGGRWVGTRMDVECPEAPENGLGWLNTTSEEEWREWERRFDQDQSLKDKVESWKKKVEASHEGGRETKASTSQAETKSVAVALSSGTGKSSQLPTIESSLKQVSVVSMNPLKDTAPFGFGVIKRSSQPNVMNTKPAGTSKKRPPKDVPGPSSVLQKEPPKEPTDVGRSNKQTTNDLEQSFIAPSFFVSQLVTSTPKQIAKPTLISNTAVSSSPLPPLTSSPKANDPDVVLANTGQSDVQNRQAATSVSLPAIPLPASPVRHTTSTTPHYANYDTNDTFNTNKKRILGSSVDGSDEAGRKLKKAKTTPSNASNAPSSVHANLGPSTPPCPVPVGQAQAATVIPTLTELLASAKKGKKKRMVSGRPSILEKTEQSKPPSSDHQTADAREQDVGKDMSPVNESMPGLGFEPRQQSHHIEDILDVDLSPAKSLSSIAGASDDEAEEEVIEHLEARGNVDPFVLDSSFHPMATSTQVQRNQHDDERHDPFLSNKPVIISQPEDSHQREDKDLNAVDSWEGIYEPRQNEVKPDPFCTAGLPGPSLSFSSPVNNKNNSNSSDHPQLSSPVYNSQFESAVAAEVDKVNKVLEQDVDYDSWLNKATAAYKKRSVREEDDDDDDDESSSRAISDHEGNSGSKGEGQNGGLSYGYGKAFEYDQSF